MQYTKASEKDGTKWSLPEFTSLRGRFSTIQEYGTNKLMGIFSNREGQTAVHIEKKVRKTPVATILKNQDDYEIIVAVNEYCLYKKGDIIDYSTIWEDSHPYETEENDFNRDEYYCENSDIFDGEVI